MSHTSRGYFPNFLQIKHIVKNTIFQVWKSLFARQLRKQVKLLKASKTLSSWAGAPVDRAPPRLGLSVWAWVGSGPSTGQSSVREDEAQGHEAHPELSEDQRDSPPSHTDPLPAATCHWPLSFLGRVPRHPASKCCPLCEPPPSPLRPINPQ